MAQLIDGKKTAAEIVSKIASEVSLLDFQPGLAVIIVGEDPASQVYVKNKTLKAKECGFKSVKHHLDESISQEALLYLIESLNKDDAIHGILVQLPLPDHIDAGAVIQAISSKKDVDGFHYLNAGMLATGAMDQALVPCTPYGVLYMLKQVHGNDMAGMEACMISHSNIVGKPMVQLLLNEECTVHICHKATKNVRDHARRADILIVATGVPHLVKGDWIKEGATVIDVGINSVEIGDGKRRLTGDVDFNAAEKVAGAITPVPGGVGPMTIAMLMVNTLKAACIAQGRDIPVL